MKTVNKSLLVITLFILMSCVGMHDKKGDRLCTTEYRKITVSVRDPQNEPVVLDDYFVRKSSTGEILDFANEDPFLDSLNRVNGIYTLMTDGMMWMTSVSGTEFTFHGLMDTVEVINEPYLIGNDECHVLLYTGNPTITLQN